MVAVFIFGQKHHLVPVVFSRFICMVLTYVKLTTHEGFDQCFFGGFAVGFRFFIGGFCRFVVTRYCAYKMKGSHHISRISECDSRHFLSTSFCHQFLNLYGRLQDRVLGMVVQVCKRDLFQAVFVFGNVDGRI